MNGVERAIRDSGQSPGHKCPCCGGPLAKDVLVSEELVIVDGVAIHVSPYLMATLHKLWDNFARPVNRQILGSSPELVRMHLHRLRQLFFHTRLVIRDVDRSAVELKLSDKR